MPQTARQLMLEGLKVSQDQSKESRTPKDRLQMLDV